MQYYYLERYSMPTDYGLYVAYKILNLATLHKYIIIYTLLIAAWWTRVFTLPSKPAVVTADNEMPKNLSSKREDEKI